MDHFYFIDVASFHEKNCYSWQHWFFLLLLHKISGNPIDNKICIVAVSFPTALPFSPIGICIYHAWTTQVLDVLQYCIMIQKRAKGLLQKMPQKLQIIFLSRRLCKSIDILAILECILMKKWFNIAMYLSFPWELKYWTSVKYFQRKGALNFKHCMCLFCYKRRKKYRPITLKREP